MKRITLTFIFQQKEVSKTKIFETASNIIAEMSDKHTDIPPFARPSHSSLLKLCNRTRKNLRPEEPTTTDFEVKMHSY